MTFEEYQTKAMSTATENVRYNLAYSMGGVAGEAGEYADLVKKMLFHGKLTTKEFADKALLELGDVLWGLAQASEACGFTLEEVAEANVVKLAARYKK